jgi:hypothetical protein
MPDYDEKDAAKDTDSTSSETEAAWHGARDDAFGDRETSGRDYDSGGDRPTDSNREEAAAIGEEHDLGKSDSDTDSDSDSSSDAEDNESESDTESDGDDDTDSDGDSDGGDD